MIAFHGRTGLLVGGLTWASGEVANDGGLGGPASILIALIGAIALVGAAVAAPMVKNWMDRRHPPVDHLAEMTEEQAVLSEWLRGQLDQATGVIQAKDAEIVELRKANDRLRRRHP